MVDHQRKMTGMLDNTITHIEIPAPDLELAIHFYSTIFNWTVQVLQSGESAFFRIGATNSGGSFETNLRPAVERTGPQLTIDVADIGTTLELIEKNGGVTILPKTAIAGDHGFYACFKDPNGNYLQLHSRS